MVVRGTGKVGGGGGSGGGGDRVVVAAVVILVEAGLSLSLTLFLLWSSSNAYLLKVARPQECRTRAEEQ